MMRTLKYNLLLVACICVAISADVIADPAKEFTKSIVKEFDISPNGLAGVSNKYGDIDVRAWNNSKVKMEVTIKVEAKNEDTANEVFDRISILFDNSASSVQAKTDIQSASSWKKWFDWGSSDQFRINYVVYVPASVEIELRNSYGDIFIGDKKGRATVDLKYGELRIGKIDGNATIDLAYSDGVVGAVGDAEIDLAYSDLNIEAAGDIELSAKYSDVVLGSSGNITSSTSYVDLKGDHIGSFTNSGKYDDFIFGHVASIDCKSNYVSFKIGEMSKFGRFELSYGSVRIDDLASGFEYIDINTSYTDVSIDVADNAQFVLEAQTRYGGIKHGGMDVTKEISKNSERTVNAHRGSASASSRITASMQYGDLVIR